MNQQPFWDFVNDMSGQSNPQAGPSRRGPRRSEPQQPWDFAPWGYPMGGYTPQANPFSYLSHPPHPSMPHRGRPGPPPPPPGHDGVPPPPPPSGPLDPPSRPGTPPTPPESVPEPHGRDRSRSRSRSPPPPFPGRDQSPHHGPGRHRHPHGRRGGCGRHGRHGPPRDADWRGFGRGYPGAAPFDLNQLPEYLNQLPAQIPAFLEGIFGPGGPSTGSAAGKHNKRDKNSGEGSFSPDVDVFNTPEAYVIHASVPGAKKTDMDVSYDAAANAIKISGVVQRPGEVDENMLNTLVDGERKVGLFERTVRLDKDVKVDADGLYAKLEDGVLRIEIPKEQEEDWTEVRKVQIE